MKETNSKIGLDISKPGYIIAPIFANKNAFLNQKVRPSPPLL